MSPDKGQRKNSKSKRAPVPAIVRTGPSPNDPFSIVYFKRHVDDDSNEAVPGQEFLNSCPTGVRAQIRAVIAAVAAAPPHKFSGGGYWEAMHGKMAGYYEVRVDGPKRSHYRLFCRLDTEAQGKGPLLVIICGAMKNFRTTLSDADYEHVRKLGAEYLAHNPRSISN